MESTIIIFLSDNGGPCHASGSCPQKPQSGCAGCNLPLKGYKHSLHEGGIRTPSFITGPGVTRGRVIDDSGSFFHVSDWCAVQTAMQISIRLESGSQIAVSESDMT